eukprot:GHVR01140275.1.p2 GENE.GHVR01140275.1~~GHVR01140275.1.p2  ORF type:complete len:126 (+),score=29.03 GHVR01140275.1:806-1183(+)
MACHVQNAASRLKLPMIGRFVGMATVGVPPEIMGIGPVVAIPAVLQLTEINEAFASQTLYCVAKLGMPKEKVNPNGGAIALGHPLGATGARMVASLLNELKRKKIRYGIVSMCIGTGMGAAAVIE